MPDEKAFNLLRENWILVRKPDGKVKEISLINLFRDAPDYHGLAGELPTQDIAILRLLLAILHAVFGRCDLQGNHRQLSSPGEALERWKSLWDNGAFPMEIIEDYLTHFEERFWLFHPEYPFYQVAPKETITDFRGLKIIPSSRDASFFIGDIAESEKKPRLFSYRTQKNCVPYGEAARWLIYTNSFDVAPGGRPSSAGITIKGYGLSWLSQLGLIWANGSNMFETLMLNFILATNEQLWSEPDVPWEQDNIYDAEFLMDTDPVFPKEPCGLLTMQFRRIQLVRCEKKHCVTGFLLWSGQSLNTENATLEMMTLWRRNKKEVLVPKLHEESRQMWRDFSSIFSVSSKEDRPGIVNWIDWLKSEELLQLPFIQFNTAGVRYKQNTLITDVFTDNLRFNLSLFTSLGEKWVNRIIDIIGATEKLVDQVGYLAQNLAKAAGDSDGNSEKRAAMDQAYFRLDTPFRRWLEEIDPKRHSMDDKCNQWWEQASKIIRNLGKELVNQSGPQSFVGRYVKGKRYTAPEAYNQFIYWTSRLLT